MCWSFARDGLAAHGSLPHKCCVPCSWEERRLPSPGRTRTQAWQIPFVLLGRQVQCDPQLGKGKAVA